MGLAVFNIIVIFYRYVHQYGPVLSEGRPLFWLVENIAPQFLGGTVSNLYFAFFDLIFDEEVPSLYVLGSFGGQESPIVCQVNREHIVLKIIFCSIEQP